MTNTPPKEKTMSSETEAIRIAAEGAEAAAKIAAEGAKAAAKIARRSEPSGDESLGCWLM